MTVSSTQRAVLLATLLGPATAVADPAPAPKAEAKERFEKGVTLYERGDHAAALVEFEAVYAADPHPQILFNIAMAEKRLFRYGEALAHFRQFLASADDSLTPARRQLVEKELRELESLVSVLRFDVSRPPGAQIVLDGQVVGRAPYAADVVVGPGNRRVEVSAAGYAAHKQTVRALSGRTIDVTVRLKPLPPARLSVTSVPAGASLLVDETPRGKTPWRGDLSPGGHTVRVTLEGYAPVRREIVLSHGQTRPLALRLEAAERPLYKRWGFWAVVGGAALATTGAVLYLSQEKGGADATLFAE